MRALSAALATGLCIWLMFGPWLSCPMVSWFHRPCPTCGIRRALLLLAHGRIAASLALQPLALPALLSFYFVATGAIGSVLGGRTPGDLLGQTRARLALASATLVFVLLLVIWAARAAGYLGGAIAI
ncbi:MAG: DUF2752 domain-containing protein [Pseudomonadota bacterium]